MAWSGIVAPEDGRANAMKTNIATSWPSVPNAALIACTPRPTATQAQNENTQSSGRCGASMFRMPTVASMIIVVVTADRPAVITIFTTSVCVRLIGTVGRRECHGPISLSA